MKQLNFSFYDNRVYIARAIGQRVVLYFPFSENQLAEERSADDFEMVQLVQANYEKREWMIGSRDPIGSACRNAYSSGGNIFAAMPLKGLAAMIRTKDEKLLEKLEKFGRVLTPSVEL